jgi:hypothetical protein
VRSASPGWSLGISAPETFLLRRREVFTKALGLPSINGLFEGNLGRYSF